jgi:hypothetical protein
MLRRFDEGEAEHEDRILGTLYSSMGVIGMVLARQ